MHEEILQDIIDDLKDYLGEDNYGNAFEIQGKIEDFIAEVEGDYEEVEDMEVGGRIEDNPEGDDVYMTVYFEDGSEYDILVFIATTIFGIDLRN